jgi:predicted nucleic acid-binding protein
MTVGGAPGRPHADRAYADTNLFITLFAGDTHPLHEPALRIFQRVADGSLRLIVTPIVLAELVYVAARVFRWSRSVTGRRLTELLGAVGLDVREAPTLARALALYGSTRSLDFADAYLAGTALEVGPPRIASLDGDLDRIPGVTRIER